MELKQSWGQLLNMPYRILLVKRTGLKTAVESYNVIIIRIGRFTDRNKQIKLFELTYFITINWEIFSLKPLYFPTFSYRKHWMRNLRDSEVQNKSNLNKNWKILESGTLFLIRQWKYKIQQLTNNGKISTTRGLKNRSLPYSAEHI